MATSPRPPTLPVEVKVEIRARTIHALAALTDSLIRPITFRARTPYANGCLTLTPRGDTRPSDGVSPGHFPGTFLSPLEAAIWNALSGGPMNAKKIAAAISQKCSPKLRTILANLCARHVIRRTSDNDYVRAEAR